MKLETYRTSEGLTLTELAGKLDRPVSTVHGWLNGDRRPSWVALAKIDRLTGGKVTAADFVPPEPVSIPEPTQPAHAEPVG